MRLLVTGCGRSGTMWFAECLRAVGLPAGHEEAFTVSDHGTEPWSVEVSWLAAPYTPWTNCYVVHLVRHPLDVVRSRVESQTFEHRDRGVNDDGEPRPTLGPWGEWAYRWCPMMRDAENPVQRAAWHWVQWNRLVTADEVVRLERCGVGTFRRLYRIVTGSEAPDFDLPEPVNVGPREGRDRIPPLSWSDIDVPHFRRVAASYGYE